MTKGASEAHCTPKEQLRPGVPQEAATGQIHISSEIKGLCESRIVWLRSHQENTMLKAYYVLYFIYYVIDLQLLILASKATCTC